MKKYKIIYALGLLCLPFASNSQNLDDVLRFNQRELTGTSRSLSMANAFGALGGDMSAISINPAGIAVYRTSEFTFTPSLSIQHNSAKFGDFSTSEDEFSLPLNQIGGVTTQKTLREKNSGLISTHFGFSYNRTADFNYTTNATRLEVADSYTNDGIIANTLLSNIMLEANGILTDNLKKRAKYAFKNYLINPLVEGSTEYFNEYEDIVDIDETTSEIINRNTKGIDQNYHIKNSGYAGEYGLTFGANISHIFLFGASLNFQSFNFEQTQTFSEFNTYGFDPAYNEDLDYFDAYTYLSQKGFGVNGKFGMILNLNPIRIGASIHTPTFYDIDEDYYEGMESFYQNNDHYWDESDFFSYSYNYRSPYRVQGSFAYIIGKKALISLDYEMTDHTSSKITSKDKYVSDYYELNQLIKDDLKASHDFKAGIEYKPLPFLAVRAGLAYFDSPFKDHVYKLDKWMYTGGFGIRNGNFFFDAAYAQTVYDDNLNTQGLFYGVTQNGNPIELSNRRHQASFTFGWKF